MYHFEWWIKGIVTGGYHCGEPACNNGLKLGLELAKEAIAKGMGVTIWFE